MRTPLVLFLVLSATLAGCLDADGGASDATDVDQAAPALPALHGWIFDSAVAPVPGVELQANAGNASLTTVTDADGFYGFDALPTGSPVVLIARAEGFIPQSKQTTLAADVVVQMNFTLEREPVIKPYHETLGPFQGFIACQYRFEANEQRFDNECGSGSNENQWQMAVGADFAGGVIELEWAENTPASTNLHAKVECATPGKCGDQIQVFSEAIGPSRLRLEIGNLVATKYYPEGGLMLLTVTVDPNNDANEAGIGGAAAVSQEFEAIASMFYHAPPPPGYTVG